MFSSLSVVLTFLSFKKMVPTSWSKLSSFLKHIKSLNKLTCNWLQKAAENNHQQHEKVDLPVVRPGGYGRLSRRTTLHHLIRQIWPLLPVKRLWKHALPAVTRTRSWRHNHSCFYLNSEPFTFQYHLFIVENTKLCLTYANSFHGYELEYGNRNKNYILCQLRSSQSVSLSLTEEFQTWVTHHT